MQRLVKNDNSTNTSWIGWNTRLPRSIQSEDGVVLGSLENAEARTELPAIHGIVHFGLKKFHPHPIFYCIERQYEHDQDFCAEGLQEINFFLNML
jgi:hypothetical protein